MMHIGNALVINGTTETVPTAVFVQLSTEPGPTDLVMVEVVAEGARPTCTIGISLAAAEPILYGDEVRALLRGQAVDPSKVDLPLYRRIVYAVAIYTMARRSELAALTVADVDLAHATIVVSKQVDRKAKGAKKGATKKTKTRRTRTIDVEPNLYPLLRWLAKHPQGKGTRLLRVPPPEDCAELLRKDLTTVGITREALHTSDDTRTAMTFHCMRDTGLTHMAVRGGLADRRPVEGWSHRFQDHGRLHPAGARRGAPHRRAAPSPPPGTLSRTCPPHTAGAGQRTDRRNAEGADRRRRPTPSGGLRGFRCRFASERNRHRKPSGFLIYFAIPMGIEPMLPT